MKRPPKKFYTISTFIFDTLEDAQERINTWVENDSFREGTLIVEATGRCYKPIIGTTFRPYQHKPKTEGKK